MRFFSAHRGNKSTKKQRHSSIGEPVTSVDQIYEAQDKAHIVEDLTNHVKELRLTYQVLDSFKHRNDIISW